MPATGRREDSEMNVVTVVTHSRNLIQVAGTEA